MFDAVILANTVLQEMWNKGKKVRPMKLQKLMYYTMGFFIRNHDHCIVNESFYKWEYGPMIPEIYELFSKYKHHPIREMGKNNENDFYVINDTRVLKTLKDVIGCYGNIPDFELTDLTREHASWYKTHLYNEISQQLLKETFSDLPYGG